MNSELDGIGEVRRGTQSLQRAIALLRELMLNNRTGASTSELAVRTAIDRTTAHRMLQCLLDEGFVFQDGDSRRYHLGPLAYEIGLAAAERVDLKALCKDALLRIAADTGDTVFLIIRSGDESVCIDRAEGSYPVKTFVVDIGTRRPLGVGAASLAILSALPDPDAQAIIDRNAQRLPQFDGMTADRLRQMMMRVRETGQIAMDVIGVQGVRAVSVPIYTRSGRAVAALSIAAVGWRMTPEREMELSRRLEIEASAIGAQLGIATDSVDSGRVD